jgi:4-amino-4-deoxy-L-arabinose transferase-like glycosyltransferase
LIPRSLSQDPLRLTLAFVGVLTAIRLVALFATPIELYPDEAQYWLWSRELAFGYFSKPPMIAWLIGLTTGVGGDDEPWVRLSSLFLHAGAALALFDAGARLYDRWIGFWSAAIYSLMPGVTLSSGVASTDAPLLFFLALSLMAYVRLGEPGAVRDRLTWAAALGAGLGLAMLSKYAALYGLIGLAAHAALSREARARWSPAALAVSGAAFAAILAPNLLWNAANGFATVSHTASNANWGAERLFNPAELADFLVGQFGVFGPIAFGALIAGCVLAVRRRRLDPRDLLLICLVAPPLIAVSIQAFVSRANANWAAAAYVAGSVLVAAWLVRWKAKRWLAGLAASQLLLTGFMTAAAVSPAFADAAGLANGLKRSRGWDATAREVIDRAETAAASGDVSAVAVDDRFLFNALAYYGRDWFGRDGRPPLLVWVRGAAPGNQAEATAPLTQDRGARVVVALLKPDLAEAAAEDFTTVVSLDPISVRLDRQRTRDLAVFLGEGFDPVRDVPASGPPTAP